MPDGPALKAGVAWKKAVVQERLGVAMSRLLGDFFDPGGRDRMRGDLDLVQRYAGELQTLDDPNNRGAAWELVKRNLVNGIAFAKERLTRLNEFFAHQDHIFPNGQELEAERRTIEDLKRKLKALEAEGKP